MNCYTPQEAVDRLHKAQLAQGNDVGKIWTHVLDLKKKVEKLETDAKKPKKFFINVNPENLS